MLPKWVLQVVFCNYILPLNIPGVLGEPLWVLKVSLGALILFTEAYFA